MWLSHSVVLVKLPNDLGFTVMSVSQAEAIIIIPISDHKSRSAIQLEAII